MIPTPASCLPGRQAPPWGHRLVAACWAAALVLGPVAPGGDMLRGGGVGGGAGGSGGTPSAGGAASAVNAAAAVNAINAANAAAAQRARDSLARTTLALQAARSVQAAARAAAISGPNNLGADPNHPGQTLPNVPDGLVAGGLVPDSGLTAPGVAAPVLSWVNAKTPVQTTDGSSTTVTIEQTAAQAILNWSSFNVGKNTTLSYQQGGTDWVALNKIQDPSGVPSQILGTIKAPGAVYVINQNGIIFGGSSRVNTRTLVASSLPINENLVSRGLVNNPDAQFLFSSLAVPSLAQNATMSAFTPPVAPLGHSGDITVQAGAELASPSTAEHIGGLIALIGPNVVNKGSITVPDGQAILAAGQQVGLLAHSSSDPSLRGLDATVGAVDDPASPVAGGAAVNSGIIETPRGSVTMVGKEVRQLGVIESLTSVGLNGRVDLLANYGASVILDSTAANILAPTATGNLTLGAESVTRILPDWESADTVVGTELSLRSQANLLGEAILLGENAALLAPNATVSLNAGTWVKTGNFVYFYNLSGQVYLDRGATIDVMGSTDVSVPVTKNLVQVELRGAELADSPLQRDGALRGQTVTVDMRQSGTFNGTAWVGSPIGNLAGYNNLIQRNVGELTTAGGTVTIAAGESVVMQPGSSINVSGGWMSYQGGTMRTTKVVSGGVVYDIAQATPDRVYDGIISDAAVALGTDGSSFEPSYIQGANAGSLTISAAAMALDGELLGASTMGRLQRSTPPLAGALALSFQSQGAGSATGPAIFFRKGSPTSADAFGLDASGHPLPLRTDRASLVEISPSFILESGLGRFNLNNGNGPVTVETGVALAGAPGGAISLVGANVTVDGSITVPGGSVTLAALDNASFVRVLPTDPPPAVDLTRGHVTLGSEASVSVAGILVDDRYGTASAQTLPLLKDGGSVSISGLCVDLAAGSLLDVSGGAVVTSSGKTATASYGKGGSLTLEGGRDPAITDLVDTGRLTLGATLTGIAGGKGGSLRILAPLVQVGGTTANPDVLLLDPDFFNEGGFASFSINGIGRNDPVAGLLTAVEIAPGTRVVPVVRSIQLDPGGDLALTPTLFPQGVRAAASLEFNSLGLQDTSSPAFVAIRGDLVVGAGARIETDPGGSVKLSGQTVEMLGSVVAPGGSITLSASTQPSANLGLGGGVGTFYSTTLHLGPDALLDASGTTVPTANAYGYHTGTVLPGGKISVSGNVVAEDGSRLDVSGASDTLDTPPSSASITVPTGLNSVGRSLLVSSSALSLVPTRVDSGGGSITLSGGSCLFLDSTLAAGAGGPSAVGGSLTVSCQGGGLAGENLRVNASGPTIPAPFYAVGQTAIGQSVVDAFGNPIEAPGFLVAGTLNGGGFDAVTLKGAVLFSGPVSLSANRSLSLASGGLLIADPVVVGSSLVLEAPQILLGMPLPLPLTLDQRRQPFFGTLAVPNYFSPTAGGGSVRATARLLELGTLALQNIGVATLDAPQGEIRGAGTFEIAGTLNLKAGVIYPPTESVLTLAAYDGAGLGTVNITGSGNLPLPLSAGGQINVYASVINQGGTLRAPIGGINLGLASSTPAADQKDWLSGQTFPSSQKVTLAPGSVTSVSAIDPVSGQEVVIPYGTVQNGLQWFDPSGVDITGGLLPSKVVQLSAAAVDVQAGSTLDLRGGGDLHAWEWLQGLGGSKDFLAGSSSFAILPWYTGFGGDLGGGGSGLSVGDQIGLAGGVYTLLPARYALLPGAYLLTPKSGTPLGTSQVQADQSVLMSGWRFNRLSTGRAGSTLVSQFELAPSAVMRNRAEYQDYSANSWLKDAALAREVAFPRLPMDAGQLVIAPTVTFGFGGTVLGGVSAGGRGSLVDLASPVDLLIAGPGVVAGAGVLPVQASALDAIGAESLLVGGYRTRTDAGTLVTVLTPNLTVDNAGSPLVGTDLILASKNGLTLSPGAILGESGPLPNPADSLFFGDAATLGSGNGLLVRVSGNISAPITRRGVDSSTQPLMTIGAGGVGASVSGTSVILDSTKRTSFDASSVVGGKAFAFNSGQISLQLEDAGALFSDVTHPVTTGLVLSRSALNVLLAGAEALSLSSYSSIDLYGHGTVGNLGVGGYTIRSLGLHAGEIRGFNTAGGIVTFNAANMLLDNAPGAVSAGSVAAASVGSTLVFQAGTLRLGANTLALDQIAQ
ncbi:MAG: filamentous hemagglutinin N-terminal domain-containing protein, partial [Verrucomicrobiia bacterium]